MSWSFSVPQTEVSDFANAANEALTNAQNDIAMYNPDGKDQAEVAVKAAITLVESGVLGKDCLISATLSGHGNPNHAPREGWANDMIHINIQQASR